MSFRKLTFLLLLPACSIGLYEKDAATDTDVGDASDVDEGDDDGADTELEADADRDGYPAGPQDCDDADASVNIGRAEACDDGRDNDCDRSIDEGCEDTSSTPVDADNDGYTTTLDCDDTDAQVNPGAAEDCTNHTDDNCDGDLDGEDVDACPADADGDGWEAEEDCDDGNHTVHPYAEERCNDVDDDCDGVVDEDATDASTWYLDADGDGYGDPSSTFDACEQPGLYVAASPEFDCDDLDGTTSPAGVEACDGADNDCDGVEDGGGVCIQTVSETFASWTTALYPTHSGGDCEYDSNCTWEGSFTMTVYSTSIEIEVAAEWLESVPDYTAASLHQTETVYEAPSGCTIVEVRDSAGNATAAGDSDTVTAAYSDSDHSVDYCYPGGVISLAAIVCDTSGDDACNNTSDDNALRRVEFDTVEIDLTGESCSP